MHYLEKNRIPQPEKGYGLSYNLNPYRSHFTLKALGTSITERAKVNRHSYEEWPNVNFRRAVWVLLSCTIETFKVAEAYHQRKTLIKELTYRYLLFRLEP